MSHNISLTNAERLLLQRHVNSDTRKAIDNKNVTIKKLEMLYQLQAKLKNSNRGATTPNTPRVE